MESSPIGALWFILARVVKWKSTLMDVRCQPMPNWSSETREMLVLSVEIRSQIGNVQLWFTSWQFCPLDGVLKITPKKSEFYIEKTNHEKIREPLFTFKLHNAELLPFWWYFSQKKSWKNSWKFIYVQATHYRTPFILTRFCTENTKLHLTPSSGNF